LEIPQAGLGELPETVRSFVGVGLPAGHRDLLAGYLEACRSTAPELRWVPADNLHLTLRFLGQARREALERLAASLRRLRPEPFELDLGGLGSFGRGSSVRVVWIAVTAGEAGLRRLAGQVEERCAASGFPAEERPYSPHLTLARARDRRGSLVPALPAPPSLPAFAVGRFQLYRSRTGPGGAVYSVLEEFGT
jgi:RNA 2',3'-cyclic 3'-phosphodiesterase